MTCLALRRKSATNLLTFSITPLRDGIAFLVGAIAIFLQGKAENYIIFLLFKRVEGDDLGICADYAPLPDKEG